MFEKAVRRVTFFDTKFLKIFLPCSLLFEYQQEHFSFHQLIGSNELEIDQTYSRLNQVCDFEFLLCAEIFRGLISVILRVELRLEIDKKSSSKSLLNKTQP